MVCASMSPSANPTKEVMLFTRIGLSSSIFVYALQNLHSDTHLARLYHLPAFLWYLS